MGAWGWTAGKWYGDENDKGIQTSEDARFYGYSAKMDKVFNNENKDLVLQFTTKYEQDIDFYSSNIDINSKEYQNIIRDAINWKEHIEKYL